MHIVVMNNENCVATHPRTVVQFTMKGEITIKIYSASKFNTLIYVHYKIVWFWTLSFIDFFDFVFYFIRISNFLWHLETKISSTLGS